MFGDLGKAIGLGDDSGNMGTLGALVGFGVGGGTGSAIGGNIGAGMDTAAAQAKANEQNKKLSQRQMDFQERMSSTAHQRQVADMRKAGLNPMLSGMGGGGASTSAGSMATVSPVDHKIGENIAKHIDMQMKETALSNAKLQGKQVQAQTDKTNVEKNLLKATEPEAKIRNDIGKKLHSSLNNITSSAKQIHKPSLQNMKRHAFESHYVKQAEKKAKSKYKQSRAAKDAARARKRKNK